MTRICWCSHRHAAGVREQLHDQRATFGNPSARHDLRELEAVLDEVVHDPPVAERNRLEQRPVDLLLARLQRQSENRAGHWRGTRQRPCHTAVAGNRSARVIGISGIQIAAPHNSMVRIAKVDGECARARRTE